jgi:hypothetical protein
MDQLSLRQLEWKNQRIRKGKAFGDNRHSAGHFVCGIVLYVHNNKLFMSKNSQDRINKVLKLSDEKFRSEITNLINSNQVPFSPATLVALFVLADQVLEDLRKTNFDKADLPSLRSSSKIYSSFQGILSSIIDAISLHNDIRKAKVQALTPLKGQGTKRNDQGLSKIKALQEQLLANGIKPVIPAEIGEENAPEDKKP